ncbi:MAG: hypothetical protein A2505_02505 [Deltaproteobacteria bacterium RIFOXYD12_FULL_55_16]|nr:MAG: hypothetical protein A2505_02505 [Deltaproteobacteria bacterium RIFOXYD12_FULL_55_16]
MAAKVAVPLSQQPTEVSIPQVISCIFIVSFAVYFNTLFNSFVFDDIQNVIENRWIKDIRYIPEIFSSQLAGFDTGYATSYYRPLVHLIYMFSYAVFGLKPWGFHLINILFHSGVCVLIFLIVSRLTVNLRFSSSSPYLSPAFISALLFATNPIHTEAVTWVAGVMDVSFTFFYLLSFYLYICADEGRKALYFLSVISFFLATICKEPALTLPAILVAYDFLFKEKHLLLSHYVKKYLPYLIVMGIYFSLRFNALGGFAPSKMLLSLSNYQYFINIFPLFMQYLQKLILPVNLSALYAFHPILSLFELRGLLSLILMLGLGLLAYKVRKDRVACFCLILLVVPLLPALYIPGLGARVFAERYLYLPSLGFTILISLLLVRLKVKNEALLIFLVILTLLYSVGTVRRNTVWKDNYSLWHDAAEKAPDSAIAHAYLGHALFSGGGVAEAIEHYKTSLKLSPADADVHMNLGVAYAMEGKTDDAISQYLAAIAIKPNHAAAYDNLGQAYAKEGLIEDAVLQHLAALAINPNYAAAYDNLGVIYGNKGLIENAITNFESAARLSPDNAVYLSHVAKAYEMKNLQR